MIVATVILSVAVIGLLSGISTSLRNAARLTAYDRAVQLARLQMNELLVDNKLARGSVVSGEFDPRQAGGLDAGWRARMTTFVMPPKPSSGDTAIDRIELEIWWMSGSERRTFALDGYRTHVIKSDELAPVPQ